MGLARNHRRLHYIGKNVQQVSVQSMSMHAAYDMHNNQVVASSAVQSQEPTSLLWRRHALTEHEHAFQNGLIF